MAKEVTIARESRVNPVNATREKARNEKRSLLSKMRELPEYDVRYELPTLQRNAEKIEAVFASNASYNKSATIRFQPSTTMEEQIIINVSKKKMLGLLKAVESDKDYSVTVSFPRTQRNQHFKSRELRYDSKRKEITFEAIPQKDDERIVRRRVPSDALIKVVDTLNKRK